MDKLIPKYFDQKNEYTYFREPIKYIDRDEKYYRFLRQSGGEVLIDTFHVNLIFDKRY